MDMEAEPSESNWITHIVATNMGFGEEHGYEEEKRFLEEHWLKKKNSD